jgi:vitamin B12 transporter
MRPGRLLFGLLAALLFGRMAHAQPDDSLKHVYLNALEIRATVLYPMDSLHGQSSWQPSAWHIANTPAASPAELLSGNPSVFVKQYAPGGLATLTLRGTGAGHTQVFWNGVPVNSSMLGQGDLSLGNAGTLGAMRLVMGGASLSDGSGGLGGVLRFTSDAPEGIRVFGEYGSFQTMRGGTSIGVSRDATRFGLALAANVAENDFPYLQTTLPGAPLVQQVHAATRQYSASTFANHRVKHTNGWLTGNLYGQMAQRQLPPTMLTTNVTEMQRDFALRGRLAWWMPLRRAGYLTTAIAAVHEGLTYQNGQAGIDAVSSFTRLHLRSDLLCNFKGRVSLRGAGLQLMHDAVLADGLPGGKTRNLASAYVSGKMEYGRLFVDGVLRQERTDSLWSPLLGYVGLEYRLFRRHMGCGVLYSRQLLLFNLSRNYRLPTLNDLYWSPGGNTALTPENSLAAELKYVGRVPTRGDSSLVLDYALAAFANQVDGWILWTPGSTGIWSPANLGRVLARGVEASLGCHAKVGKMRIHLETAYSLTRSTNTLARTAADSSVGKQLIYTPVQGARGLAGMEWGVWRLTYQQNFTSRRFISSDNADWLTGYTTGDLSLGWRQGLDKRPEAEGVQATAASRRVLDLRLIAGNLWNVQYQTLAWRPMPGRSLSVRLQFEW